MFESTKRTIEKIEMLQKIKFSKSHYHPVFLENMKYHIKNGKDIGYNARLLIERSFKKRFPGYTLNATE